MTSKNKEIMDNAAETQWFQLDNKLKEKLFLTLKHELLSQNRPLLPIEEMMEALRCYYNNKRKILKLREDTNMRRRKRKLNKLNVKKHVSIFEKNKT